MNRIALLLIGSALASSTFAQKISLVGGTVINPADGKRIENAVIVINGNKIESVASRKESGVPVGSKWVECDKKFILPGYIDTHVHFFQSGDLFTRPDGVDFNNVRPYKDEVAWIKSHLNDTFARYLRCGIISVVDLHLQQSARLGVERGFPELLGVHLAQAFVALHGNAFAAGVFDGL